MYLWEVYTAGSRDFASTLNSAVKELCDALGKSLNSLACFFTCLKKKKKIKPGVLKPGCISELYGNELRILIPRHNSTQMEFNSMESRTLESVCNQIFVKASFTAFPQGLPLYRMSLYLEILIGNIALPPNIGPIFWPVFWGILTKGLDYYWAYLASISSIYCILSCSLFSFLPVPDQTGTKSTLLSD